MSLKGSHFKCKHSTLKPKHPRSHIDPFSSSLKCVCLSAFLWIGSNRFYDNIEDMIGYRPLSLIKWCWKVVTPGICAVRLAEKYPPIPFPTCLTATLQLQSAQLKPSLRRVMSPRSLPPDTL